MSSYRPFASGPFRLTMGIRTLDPQDWIELGPDVPDQMAERRRLLSERTDEVLAGPPESVAAQRELLSLLVQHLQTRSPNLYGDAPGSMLDPWTGERQVLAEECEPLALIGRLIPEDVCLLRAGPEGYRLIAAVLCFPSHWRLADKLGRNLDLIHGPVPGFAEDLASAVNRFFQGIRVERPVWRLNWSLTDTDELFLPPVHRETERVFEDGRGWWLRVERQTLRRLPETGVVVFTIRTHLDPLAEVAREPGCAAELAGRLREMPDAMLRYKGLAAVRPAILAWLERMAEAQVAASGGGSAPIGLPTVSNGPSRPRSSKARESTQCTVGNASSDQGMSRHPNKPSSRVSEPAATSSESSLAR